MWTSSGTNFVFEISVNNIPQNVFFGYMLLSRYELKAYNFCEVAIGMQKNGFFKFKKLKSEINQKTDQFYCYQQNMLKIYINVVNFCSEIRCVTVKLYI